MPSHNVPLSISIPALKVLSPDKVNLPTPSLTKVIESRQKLLRKEPVHLYNQYICTRGYLDGIFCIAPCKVHGTRKGCIGSRMILSKPSTRVSSARPLLSRINVPRHYHPLSIQLLEFFGSQVKL